MFTINAEASSLGTGSITYYDSASLTRRRSVPPAEASYAVLLAPCRFASTNKATGVFGTADGTCELTTIYENWQWYLCDVHILPSPGSSFFSSFRF